VRSKCAYLVRASRQPTLTFNSANASAGASGSCFEPGRASVVFGYMFARADLSMQCTHLAQGPADRSSRRFAHRWKRKSKAGGRMHRSKPRQRHGGRSARLRRGLGQRECRSRTSFLPSRHPLGSAPEILGVCAREAARCGDGMPLLLHCSGLKTVEIKVESTLRS
jgi:hypothetical protein